MKVFESILLSHAEQKRRYKMRQRINGHNHVHAIRTHA